MARFGRALSLAASRLRGPRLRRGAAAVLTIAGLAAGSASIAAAAGAGDGTAGSTPPTVTTLRGSGVTGWITTADGSRRLAPVAPGEIVSGTVANATTVAIDPATRYQPIDGYGGALTESSAWLVSQLPVDQRDSTLRALFDPESGAGLSYVRVALGASDFALSAYSYDDMPPGQTDPTLARFSVAHDDTMIVPMLREIRRINPNVRFLASPWSAPAWMKDSGTLYGGSLNDEYLDVFARYLVKAVQAYATRGIIFDTLTVQNEPLWSGTDYPTMMLSTLQEATLIGSYVGPALTQLHLTTKILALDHNWEDSDYAMSVLADTTAARYVAGTAWHCYGGDMSVQSTVHDAYPSKATYFTECSGRDPSTDFGTNLAWNARNILGTIHNWSRTALLWNLAVDPSRGPHTGGCTDCRGVLTVDLGTNAVTENPEYYVLAQAAKIVVPGSIRVASPWDPDGMSTLAFVNPDGSHAAVLYNGSASAQAVTITGAGTTFTVTVPAGAVGSYRW